MTCHFSISNVRLAFWAFFRKPEILGSHTGSGWWTQWPGRERWPKWPIDPVTQWPSCMCGVYCRRRSVGRHRRRDEAHPAAVSAGHQPAIARAEPRLRRPGRRGPQRRREGQGTGSHRPRGSFAGGRSRQVRRVRLGDLAVSASDVPDLSAESVIEWSLPPVTRRLFFSDVLQFFGTVCWALGRASGR